MAVFEVVFGQFCCGFGHLEVVFGHFEVVCGWSMGGLDRSFDQIQL